VGVGAAELQRGECSKHEDRACDRDQLAGPHAYSR
jgi:hypothetical protein